MRSESQILTALSALSLLAGFTVATPAPGENPAEHLPPHLRQVTWFGERADWSHDGKRILFLSKTFGDAMELELDGSGTYERLTYFSDYPGYKASNPVVSDDGRWIAFQLAKSREAAGVGHGIFILDLEKAPRVPQPK